MSFMDILLKSNSVSVYDILKHQEIEEIRKQETVQDTIFQYLERRRNSWENTTQQELGHVISNRRLTAIFNEAKQRNDKTQLDEHVDENVHYTAPKKGMPRPNVSASEKGGKHLMRSVLLKVSNVVGPEESKIILVLRDFIDEGRIQSSQRQRTEIEQLIGGNGGLIDRLRAGRHNQTIQNNRYMSKLKQAGLYHDKFLIRLGSAIDNNNDRNTFHPRFWTELNGGDPLGIDLLKDFLNSQGSTIPNTTKMKGFYRQLKSGNMMNASTKVKQLLAQREKPDEEIYNFESEGVLREDITKIMEYKELVVERFKTALDKFRDDNGEFTTDNHETEIHTKIKSKTNRQLAEIDFDKEYGDVIEKDIGTIEKLWETLLEIQDALKVIFERTNLTDDISDIDNELLQEKMALAISIHDYDNYLESNKRLTDRLEAGERTSRKLQQEERRSGNVMDYHKKSYLNLKRIQAEIPNKG